MKTLLLACEVLRPELEMLAAELTDPPEFQFLEQRLHDYPDKLRATVQERVDAFEQDNKGEERIKIIFGYGLCGRGLHDCIPLLMGCGQKEAGASSREGVTYWLTPGWLQSFLIPFYLEAHKRFALYAAKFGEVKAARMMKAEKSNLSAYKKACHIRWPEMGETWVADARKVAGEMELEYSEIAGRADYLRKLLAGGEDPELFLHLQPGETLDMDLDGAIIAAPYTPPDAAS